jgi:hypothetical protein
MKTLVLIALILPTLAVAEKKMTVKDMSVLGKIDESNFKVKDPQTNTDFAAPAKNESKMNMICKEQDGRTFKQGEVGYDTCLNGLKNRSALSKRDSGVNANNKQDQASAGVSFKIGD